MPNFDDEDLPISTSSASTQAPPTADLDVDWGDQDAMSTTDGLDRIVPSDKKSKVRVAVLTDIVAPKMAWLHFIEKDGKKATYRCHTKRDKKHVVQGEAADCCKKLNHDDDQKAQLNFVVLAVKYLNVDPATGKFLKDGEGNTTPIRYELGWIKLSRTGFKAVSELAVEDEKPHTFDFTIANKEGSGIGYEYRKIANAAAFRKIPELKDEIFAEAEKYKDGVLLSKRLGKVISAIDMKALLAGKSAAASSQIDNTDDL